MPARHITKPNARVGSSRVPRDGVLTMPEWAPEGALLAMMPRTYNWSQMGFGVEDGLLEVVVRHQTEPDLCTVAELDRPAAARFVADFAAVLSGEVRSASVACELGRRWSKVHIQRLTPRVQIVPGDLLVFTIRHHEDLGDLNCATLPLRHAQRLLEIAERLVSRADLSVAAPAPDRASGLTAAA